MARLPDQVAAAIAAAISVVLERPVEDVRLHIKGPQATWDIDAWTLLGRFDALQRRSPQPRRGGR